MVPGPGEEVAPCTDGPHTSIVIKAPLLDNDGTPWAVCGIATDITERKRFEEALRQSEERLRLALEAARMGSWDWDIPANRLIWLDNGEAVLGLAPGNFDGTFEVFQRLIHPDDRQAVEHAIGRAIEARSNYEAQFRLARPDGSIRWIEGKGRMHYDDRGRPARLLGVGMDITGRKRVEQEIFVLNAELEARLERINALRLLGPALSTSTLTGVMTSPASPPIYKLDIWESRTRGSTPTRWSPSARPSRARYWPAT